MKPLILLYLLIFPGMVQAQQAELSVPGQNLFVNKINVVQSLNPGWNGAGITVSIKEFGFDTTDVDLLGRVLPSANASNEQTIHANIVASLVGGAGNADRQGRGAAPGCQLVSSSFVGLQPDSDYETQNITVQNHSYGVDIQNWYGTAAVAYDQTTVDYPNLLHVFSAGNKGDSTSKSGVYAGIPGFANLTGNFKMAKNILLVGAVDSMGHLDPFSSRGPAYDGRIKPDLVAFGYDGSSGAAALVSGSAAVVQQVLANNGPGSELIRAILIHSADDIGAPGPDFESGFGNLNLKKAISLADGKSFATGNVSEGQTISIPLNIPDQIKQVKITLVWNDPTAALFASKALFHNLDLTLLDPQGNEHFPWVLNAYPQLDSLHQVAHRGRDTLNNVEQITVELPASGLWEIRVSGAQIPGGKQHFALAWSWDTFQHFEWDYPFVNDPAPANTEVMLRWETNLPDTFARIEWRPWPSPDWRLVKDSVLLQRGWQRWVLPDTFAESQVRMVIDGHEFNSFIFLISKELRVKIGFNCPDSAMLYWNAPHPGAQYQLYGLGEQEMEPVLICTDTFIVLQKSIFPQARFAVAPLTVWQDALGPRSPAPDISKQGVRCYFWNFLAELNPEDQVDLTLQIGTSYGLSKVFFEKEINGAFVTLDEQVAEGEDFTFVDEHPQKGINLYRSRLLLDNGATLLGDTAKVYFTGEKGWWVFPNPIASGGMLQVASQTDGEAVFVLFDLLGRHVLEKKLEELGVGIPLDGLPKGVYFYKIKNGAIFTGTGKLIVQ